MTAPPATAALVSVGEEILAGDVADTNAREVANALRALGIAIRSIQVVGDRVEDIAAALTRATATSPLVVLTGGLGPTRDDVTRHGLAAAAGENLVEDAAGVAQIERFFARFGRPMSDSNRVQALRPASARLIENDRGTAPGLRMTLSGAEVFVLPGVPAEMRLMLETAVLPWVRERFPGGAPRPRIRVHGHGLPESVAGERIADLMGDACDPQVGITVSSGILTVTITSGKGDRTVACADVERIAADVERRFGAAAFGRDGVTLEEQVVELLRQTGRRLAVAESCTGGLLARLVTRVPGASEVFIEGAVTYCNDAKRRRLGVRAEILAAHGAVSEAVVLAMARGLAAATRADLTVAISGIAGPGGGTVEKPVGLVWFGLWNAGTEESRRVVFTGDRETIQLRAARYALDLIRRAVALRV